MSWACKTDLRCLQSKFSSFHVQQTVALGSNLKWQILNVCGGVLELGGPEEVWENWEVGIALGWVGRGGRWPLVVVRLEDNSLRKTFLGCFYFSGLAGCVGRSSISTLVCVVGLRECLVVNFGVCATARIERHR